MTDYSGFMTQAERDIREAYNELALCRFAMGVDKLENALLQIETALVIIRRKRDSLRSGDRG